MLVDAMNSALQLPICLFESLDMKSLSCAKMKNLSKKILEKGVSQYGTQVFSQINCTQTFRFVHRSATDNRCTCITCV